MPRIMAASSLASVADEETSMAIFGAMIAVLGGLLIIWLAIRMWQEKLPRNSIAGVIAGGIAAALLPSSTGAIALFAGVVAFGGLVIAGGIKGVRACR